MTHADTDRAREVLRTLILSDPCRVDRYDASYLDDLPDILREMHGMTSLRSGPSHAVARVGELASLSGLSLDAPLSELAPALRRIGITDAEFRPRRLDDPEMQDKFRYSRMASWAEVHGREAAEGVRAVDAIRRFQEEYSRKSERSLLHPRYIARWFKYRYGMQKYGLGRPGFGDPWTPLFKSLIERGALSTDAQVLTLGPRTIGEIRYFRKIIGLRNTVGLDLFSYHRGMVVAGDMHEMPFPDSHFHVVFQRNTFDKAYDIRRVMGECVRVLCSGGLLASDLSLDYKLGVDEAARTNITRNEWYKRFLGPHLGEILLETEETHPDEWAGRIGRIAMRINK